MTETHDTRLRRLRLRSWRRGMKEMDVILGGFADHALAGLDADALDAHEALMQEADQDLYLWISGQNKPPELHISAILRLQAYLEQQSFQKTSSA